MSWKGWPNQKKNFLSNTMGASPGVVVGLRKTEDWNVISWTGKEGPRKPSPTCPWASSSVEWFSKIRYRMMGLEGYVGIENKT